MRPGDLIGDRYRVERKLGEGGMSEVWVAIDTRFDLPVALKVATPRGAGVDEFRGRFKREALVGRLLGSHATGFVRVLDWGEVDAEALFLVMDLVEGGKDLDVSRGPREQRLLRMLRAAQLVRDAHARGIVHRDIKPSNFLIRPDGEVFLTDFGLAKLVDKEEGPEQLVAMGSMTHTGLAMGTPYFMAPEQFDAKHVDDKADVWALGVMLYQALTGDLPFKGSIPELVQRMDHMRQGLIAPPSAAAKDPSAPAELDHLCRRCQAFDAEDRPSAAELAEELEKALGVEVAAQQKAGTRAAPRPPAKAPAKAGGSGKQQALPAPTVADGLLFKSQAFDGAAADPEATIAPPVAEAPPPPPRPKQPRPAPKPVVSQTDETLTDDPDATIAPPTGERTVDERLRPAPGTEAPHAGPPLGLKRAGGELQSQVDGSLLVEVPAGAYLPRLASADQPAGTLAQVQVGRFLIGKHPVTWGQFRRFCSATGRVPPTPEHAVTDAHPVHGVTFDEAKAYCAWAGLRLPRDTEWEYAASGEEGRRYPWGDAPPSPLHCAWAGHPTPGTLPVGACPGGASPFGVQDMAGNVNEWVDDGRAAAATRSLRGGGWRHDAQLLEVRRRHLLPGGTREPDVGFRVARDADGVAAAAPPAGLQIPPTIRTNDPRPPGGFVDPRLAARPAPKPAPKPKPKPKRRPAAASSGEYQALPDDRRERAGELAARLQGRLPAQASGASRKGPEVKFTWTSEGSSRGVPLSLIVVDPERGLVLLEQRVTLDKAALQGAPTGWSNLLRGANAATGALPRVAVVPSEDRLRYRRPLVVDPGAEAPLPADALGEAIDLLLLGWARLVEPFKRAQKGEPWPTALKSIVDAPRRAGPAKQLEELAARLPKTWTREKGPDGVSVRPSGVEEFAPAVLLAGGDEVRAERLLRPWPGKQADSKDLRSGEASPRLDGLLEALAARTLATGIVHHFEPGRGVVARLPLGETPTPLDLERAVDILIRGADEPFSVAGW